jgi:hypothetical protein
MYPFSFFSTWAIGVLNGYNIKDNGLPKSIIYGTLGVTSFANMIKVFGNFDVEKNAMTHKSAKALLGAAFIGVPIVMGTTFCTGNYLGKAVRYVKDIPSDPDDKKVKIHLV